jgi:hypothetical protein
VEGPASCEDEAPFEVPSADMRMRLLGHECEVEECRLDVNMEGWMRGVARMNGWDWTRVACTPVPRMALWRKQQPKSGTGKPNRGFVCIRQLHSYISLTSRNTSVFTLSITAVFRYSKQGRSSRARSIE